MMLNGDLNQDQWYQVFMPLVRLFQGIDRFANIRVRVINVRTEEVN